MDNIYVENFNIPEFRQCNELFVVIDGKEISIQHYISHKFSDSFQSLNMNENQYENIDASMIIDDVIPILISRIYMRIHIVEIETIVDRINHAILFQICANYGKCKCSVGSKNKSFIVEFEIKSSLNNFLNHKDSIILQILETAIIAN